MRSAASRPRCSTTCSTWGPSPHRHSRDLRCDPRSRRLVIRRGDHQRHRGYRGGADDAYPRERHGPRSGLPRRARRGLRARGGDRPRRRRLDHLGGLSAAALGHLPRRGREPADDRPRAARRPRGARRPGAGRHRLGGAQARRRGGVGDGRGGVHRRRLLARRTELRERLARACGISHVLTAGRALASGAGGSFEVY